MKKLLYTTVLVIVLLFAIHASFFALTNMTVHEFLTYLFIDDEDDGEMPVFIPYE